MKNALSIALCGATLLLLQSCATAHQNDPTARADTPSTLPAGMGDSASLLPLSGTWIRTSQHISSDACCLKVEPDSEDLPGGRTLELHLCGTPYSTASGNAWQRPIATISKPGEYIYKLTGNDFRKSGGPYDYSVSYTLRDAKGKELDRQECRLSHHIPGPGWEAYFEKENRERLRELQNAAAHCATMRLVLDYHADGIYDTEVELPLSRKDAEELRRLISRMRPIKTHLHEILPMYRKELRLLDAAGNELLCMNPSDVSREQFVSPEGLADMSFYALSNEDADAWYGIINSQKVKAAIDAAVKKAQKKRRKRR